MPYDGVDRCSRSSPRAAAAPDSPPKPARDPSGPDAHARRRCAHVTRSGCDTYANTPARATRAAASHRRRRHRTRRDDKRRAGALGHPRRGDTRQTAAVDAGHLEEDRGESAPTRSNVAAAAGSERRQATVELAGHDEVDVLARRSPRRCRPPRTAPSSRPAAQRLIREARTEPEQAARGLSSASCRRASASARARERKVDVRRAEREVRACDQERCDDQVVERRRRLEHRRP